MEIKTGTFHVSFCHLQLTDKHSERTTTQGPEMKEITSHNIRFLTLVFEDKLITY